MAKLLLDQNLSFRLVERLQPDFPGTSHVRLHGLEKSTDRDVWNFAKQNGFAILSKDSDFRHMAVLRRSPPKTIVIRCGNASTAKIVEILAYRKHEMLLFLEESETSLLVFHDIGT